VLESTRVKCGLKIVRVQMCLCVGLWTAFGWKLSDCKNGSECWMIATRGPAGRIL
jgi:hypothetical protein